MVSAPWSEGVNALVKVAAAVAAVVALVVLALVGYIVYQRSEITDLRRENAVLVAARKTDREALALAGKSAQTGRTQAAKALEELRDPKLSDWRSAPLPDGVRDALAKGATGAPGALSNPAVP